jgi:uncharacterized protein (DUF305 family)
MLTTFPKTQTIVLAVVCSGALLASVFPTPTVTADYPGQGDTALVEQRFLHAIIDHHYSALRMTELAAGTQLHSPASAIDPHDQTHPSPGFPPTQARATSIAVKSLARKNNRGQREEILTAQRLLLDFYGQTHVPQLSPQALGMIHRLENIPAGPAFDEAFLRAFSVHHYEALKLVVDCLAGADLTHGSLRRYCRGILEAQVLGIESMRQMLCTEYGDCGFVPFDVH